MTRRGSASDLTNARSGGGAILGADNSEMMLLDSRTPLWLLDDSHVSGPDDQFGASRKRGEQLDVAPARERDDGGVEGNQMRCVAARQCQ